MTSPSKRGTGARKNAKPTLSCGALFSGIGGFCMAFEAAGYRTAWACDVDPYACAVYRDNFPANRLIEKDIRKLSVRRDKLEPVDVLHAGFPCQSFSQAGSRTGFDDERGKLFFEIIRLVGEFKSAKPGVLVFENAPYLQWGDGGHWFSEVTRHLQQAGYWFRQSNAQELDLFALTHIPRELADYFADVGEEEGGAKGEEVNPVGKIDIRAQPLKRRPVVIHTDEPGDEGGTGSPDPGEGGAGRRKGGRGRARSGKGWFRPEVGQDGRAKYVRSVLLSGKRRRVAATPAFSGMMELVVYEAGADTDRRLNVAKSSAGKIRSGAVRNLNARRGNRITIEVELDAPFYGAMKVAAYAI